MRTLILVLLAGCPSATTETERDSTPTQSDVTYCTPASLTSAGIQDCVDAVSGGPISGVVDLGAGIYNLDTPIVVSSPYTIIRGMGRGGTLLQFSDTGPVFDFQGPAGGCEITGVYIYAWQPNVVGIAAADTTEMVIRDVRLLLQGDDSIGLDLRTRDSVSVDGVTVVADKPVELGGASAVSVFDHVNFNNFYAIETGNDDPIVRIAPDVRVQDLSFTGYQAWVGGSYGLHWGLASVQQGKSTRISLHNVRREQAGSSGASVYIERSQYDHLDHFTCDNCTFAYESHGLQLTNVSYPSITMSTFDGAPGKTFLSVNGAVELYTRQNLVVERE